MMQVVVVRSSVSDRRSFVKRKATKKTDEVKADVDERCYSISGKASIEFVVVKKGALTFTIRFSQTAGQDSVLGITLVGALPGLYHTAFHELRFIEASTMVVDTLHAVTPAPTMMVPASVWAMCLQLDAPPVPRCDRGRPWGSSPVAVGRVAIDAAALVDILLERLRHLAGAIWEAMRRTAWNGHKLSVLVHGSRTDLVMLLGFEHQRDQREQRENEGNHHTFDKKTHMHVIKTGLGERAFRSVAHVVRRVRPHVCVELDVRDGQVRVRLELQQHLRTTSNVDRSVEDAMGLPSGAVIAELEAVVPQALERAAMVHTIRNKFGKEIRRSTGIAAELQSCFCNTCGDICRPSEMLRCVDCMHAAFCKACGGPPPGHRDICKMGFWGIEAKF